MLAVNYTNFRENMRSYMDKVTDDYETMVVTRKDNKNVVMISEETYNNMLENIYVIGNKSNYDWLMESKAQLEKQSQSGIFSKWRKGKFKRPFTPNGVDVISRQRKDLLLLKNLKRRFKKRQKKICL